MIQPEDIIFSKGHFPGMRGTEEGRVIVQAMNFYANQKTTPLKAAINTTPIPFCDHNWEEHPTNAERKQCTHCKIFHRTDHYLRYF